MAIIRKLFCKNRVYSGELLPRAVRKTVLYLFSASVRKTVLYLMQLRKTVLWERPCCTPGVFRRASTPGCERDRAVPFLFHGPLRILSLFLSFLLFSSLFFSFLLFSSRLLYFLLLSSLFFSFLLFSSLFFSFLLFSSRLRCCFLVCVAMYCHCCFKCQLSCLVCMFSLKYSSSSRGKYVHYHYYS